MKEQPIFCETLDYIFYSPGLRVESVLPLSRREAVKGPFPSEEEPSDHVLIAAELVLLDKDKRKDKRQQE